MARKRVLQAAERRAQRREAERLFGIGNTEPVMAGPGHEHPAGPRCPIPD